MGVVWPSLAMVIVDMMVLFCLRPCLLVYTFPSQIFKVFLFALFIQEGRICTCNGLSLLCDVISATLGGFGELSPIRWFFCALGGLLPFPFLLLTWMLISLCIMLLSYFFVDFWLVSAPHRLVISLFGSVIGPEEILGRLQCSPHNS